MRFLSILYFVLFLSAKLYAQRTFLLFSPDSSLRTTIKVADHLSYELYAGSVFLEGSSSIDVTLLYGEQLSDALSDLNYKYSDVDESIAVPIPYRRKTIQDRYKQLTFFFKDSFLVEFRLYNNGLAYRIGISSGDTVFIQNETALFDIDKQAALWFSHIQKRDGRDQFHTSFEGVYRSEILSDIPDTMLTYSPVVASLPNGYKLAISDANLSDYPGMFLKPSSRGLQGCFAPYPVREEKTKDDFPQYIVTQRANYIAKVKGTIMLPWRAILVAKNDIDLPSNDLLYILGDSSRIANPSWIKYGKGTDEWITSINLFNVPFKAGINTASYKYYIDFAKKFGFDQVMLDAGWSDNNDLFKVNPDIDIKELTAYAKEKNIRLMLWTLSSTLDRQLDSALTQFNNWGVQSIMTDFMDRDDQLMVNFYHRVAKACAEHKITIMFHGAFPPKGLNRTWPNVITHEGVLGSEWNIWSDLVTPEHDVAIAYTRMIAGPLDYEPGILLNTQKDQFRPMAKNPMSQGTRCHQLAMFVTYDSPLQIFSGNISQGLLEPKFMELLGSIPTTWDETKILQGTIGEYIITARRKGEDWFIGGLNGTTKRTVTLSFGFLGKKNYSITICRDGINAATYGSDYELNNYSLDPAQSLTITMEEGGGFLIKISNK